MSKTLSIIIPTYNMEKYLDRCLSSLLVNDSSLFESLEVIIVNDGSKDRSSEIAHQYQSKYPETFAVIDKQNGNYGSCINAALPLAKGKYVKVLDSDDWFSKCALESFLRFIQSIDVDLILTQTNVINDKDEIVQQYSQKGIFPVEEILCFDEINKSCYYKYITMHNVTYKTENLRKIQYRQQEGISYTDQQWIHLPMTTVKNFISLDIYLYQYLVGREGQTVGSETLKRKFKDEELVDLILIDNCLKYIGDLEHTAYLYNRMFHHQAVIYQGGIFENRYNEKDIKALDIKIKNKYPEIHKKLGSFFIEDKEKETGILINQWRNPFWKQIYPIRNSFNALRVKLALGHLLN